MILLASFLVHKEFCTRWSLFSLLQICLAFQSIFNSSIEWNIWPVRKLIGTYIKCLSLSLDPGKPLRYPERGPNWQSQPSILVIILNDPLVLTFAYKRWHASPILSLKWKTTFGFLKCVFLSLNESHYHPCQDCHLHKSF